MKLVYEHKREVERIPLRFAHRKPEYKKHFTKVFEQTAIIWINKINSVYSYKVFCYLLTQCTWNCLTYHTQEQIAKALYMKQSHVSEAIKELSEWDLIEVKKQGRQNVYRVNGLYAEKGGLEQKS